MILCQPVITSKTQKVYITEYFYTLIYYTSLPINIYKHNFIYINY